KEYTSNYGARLRVKKGDKIRNGGKITEGAISPKKLLEVSDIAAVERYILKEIQKVYRAQGIGISDKHIEVIIRQMLRKVAIIEGGDTNMLPGTLVELDEFTEKNEDALLSGRHPALARPVILGITKASLQTKSFLSAASFQETTRVLTDAAIKAKTDILHGLKENVITGKLIPAGRGLHSDEEEEALVKSFSVQEKMKEVKQQYIEVHDRPDDLD
ncbi:MAG: DNA-directed RNA polymerase subunit beta', partial [Bacilli bacterium]